MAEDAGTTRGAKAEGATKPKRRWRIGTHKVRWTVRWLVGGPIAVAAGVLLLMRSPVVPWVLTSTVRSLTGCEAVTKAGGGGWPRAYIALDGRLVVTGLRVVAPGLAGGIDGEAGRLLEADRAEVELDWTGVWKGKVEARSIRLENPTFLVSQETGGERLNISSITTSQGGRGATPAPPTIDVVNGRVVLGEHDAQTGAVTKLRTLAVSGQLAPVHATRPVYVVRLQEVKPAAAGLMLSGQLDLDTSTSSLRIFNLALDWPAESVPSAYRELWRRLDVQGRIASASLEYDPISGPRVEMRVDRVSMNALIPAQPDVKNPKDMGLRDVTGVIRFSSAGLTADLTASIDDQEGQSRVVLETDGLDFNAPMTCRIEGTRFVVTKAPAFLAYIPPVAREYFTFFSGPTGKVDARLTLTRGRGSNGQAGEVKISGGELDLTDGFAAFHRFPYPILDLHGRVEFDDTHIRLVKLEGSGPTGAKLVASGVISPINSDAGVDVTVSVRGAPIDDELIKAMPEGRRAVLTTIFNRERYEALVAAGLVSRPGSTAGVVGPSPPEFGLAGLADFQVRVIRPVGDIVPWETTIDVSIPEAGVVVEKVPYPVVARDVKLRVTDDDARVLGGTFRPLGGGTLDLSVLVLFTENGQKVVKPNIRVHAEDVPIDRYIAHAVPGGEAASMGKDDPGKGESGGRLTAGALLRKLNLVGTLDADAHVTPLEEPGAEAGDVDYGVSVALDGVHAVPSSGLDTPAFELEGFSGAVVVNRKELRVSSLGARLVRLIDPDDARTLERPVCADVTLDVRAGLTDADRAVNARLMLKGLNLEDPIDRLVRVVQPVAADRLLEMREKLAPMGRIDVGIAAATGPTATATSSDTSLAVEVSSPKDVSVKALAGRVGIEAERGSVVVDMPSAGPAGVWFHDVSMGLTFDGQPSGRIMADGHVRVDAEKLAVRGPADVRATLEDWRFESPLVGPFVESVASALARERYDGLKARGSLDADVRLADRAGGVDVLATLRPRALAFDYGGERIDMTQVDGSITLKARAPAGAGGAGGESDATESVGGRVDQLRVKTAQWSAGANGTWSMDGRSPRDGSAMLTIDLGLWLDAQRVDPGLMALLPGAAGRALASLEAKFAGPVKMDGARVKTELGMDGTPDATRFVGDVAFSDLSFTAGLPVRGAAGRLGLRVDDPRGDGPTTYSATLRGERLSVQGVAMTDVLARLSGGSAPGRVVLDEVSAECHGGRVVGSAQLQLPMDAGTGAGASGAGEQTVYQAEMTLAGVRLAPVLADVAAAGLTPEGPVGPPDPEQEPDPSRGVIDARLTLSGLAGKPETRLGRGLIRIAEGDVIRMPVLLALIQLSNLQLPSRDRLGYVQSSVAVAGNTAVFEDVSVLSKSVSIVGSGTLDLPSLTLDMRFNSRSTGRVPVWSDVFELVRDEMITTRITGALANPKVTSEPLVGTRTALERMFNSAARYQSADLARAEAAARAERDRYVRAGAAILPVAAESER